MNGFKTDIDNLGKIEANTILTVDKVIIKGSGEVFSGVEKHPLKYPITILVSKFYCMVYDTPISYTYWTDLSTGLFYDAESYIFKGVLAYPDVSVDMGFASKPKLA